MQTYILLYCKFFKTAVVNTNEIRLCFNLGLSDTFNTVCYYYGYATDLVQFDRAHSDQQKVPKKL